MNKITTITSTWHNLSRTTILWANVGIIELETFPDKPFAYIYNLFVKPQHRRKGYATILLNEAEQEAKRLGAKSVKLEWDNRDTPVEIFKWYERKGYEERAFGNECSLLEKQLV